AWRRPSATRAWSSSPDSTCMLPRRRTSPTSAADAPRSLARLTSRCRVGAVRPTDIELLKTPGRPALSGELLLVAVSRPDLDTNSYVSALHRVGDDGLSAWTHGAHDSSPVISPDGRWVAFLRGEGSG